MKNNDVKFIDGIRVYKPNDNAPDFIKANLVFNKSELMEFLLGQGDEFRGVVKESQGGNYYLAVDTYEPKVKPQNNKPESPINEGVDNGEDLPF